MRQCALENEVSEWVGTGWRRQEGRTSVSVMTRTKKEREGEENVERCKQGLLLDKYIFDIHPTWYDTSHTSLIHGRLSDVDTARPHAMHAKHARQRRMNFF